MSRAQEQAWQLKQQTVGNRISLKTYNHVKIVTVLFCSEFYQVLFLAHNLAVYTKCCSDHELGIVSEPLILFCLPYETSRTEVGEFK